jgi:crotonobetainyl-CoA:carnitine CoA-transferase CaiB-like acyl-CoA transferase
LVQNKTKQEIQILLEGIPTSPINSISEALTDPQSVARGVITQFEGNPILASPLRFMTSE